MNGLKKAGPNMSPKKSLAAYFLRGNLLYFLRHRIVGCRHLSTSQGHL